MGLSITNEHVEALARELSRLRGVSITEAIRQSLENEVERAERAGVRPQSDRLRAMIEISERAARLPKISDMTEHEILGYDESGIPSQ